MKKPTTEHLATNPHYLRNLPSWVKEHFVTASKPEQPFNVSSYTKKQKDDAIDELTEAGYLVTLSDNGNSLLVYDVVLMEAAKVD